MITNNEAVDNFLNGKRNLAAYQFSQLIKETTTINNNHTNKSNNISGTIQAHNSASALQQQQQQQQQVSSSTSPSSSSLFATTPSSQLRLGNDIIDQFTADIEPKPTTSTSSGNLNSSNSSGNVTNTKKQNINCDEIAFNYAMVNLFTGCPERAATIFSDLVKRYPRNPRLWLRLAESMLAAERSKMSEFDHIQQLAHPHSRDHLIKTKNRPILIKINPNYCQQLKSQQSSNKAPPETPANFLISIKGYLQKSLDLINEYNDISLLTDDIPSSTNQLQTQKQQTPTIQDLIGGMSSTPTKTAPTSIDYLNDSSQATSISLFDSQQRATTSSTPSSPVLANVQLSQQLSYANPYKSISRSALYHLRNKVILNLAYICLCMGEPIKALNYTTQCLKSSPQGYEKVLASLYHAEACILASRIDEAIQFLNLEVLNMAKNLSQDHLLNIGDSGRIVFSDEMQHQFDRDTLATVVTYNLSVAYAAKGEFNNAHKILSRCIQPTKPIPMQLIICLLYIQLQQGQVESAKKTILSNLPQFR